MFIASTHLTRALSRAALAASGWSARLGIVRADEPRSRLGGDVGSGCLLAILVPPLAAILAQRHHDCDLVFEGIQVVMATTALTDNRDFLGGFFPARASAVPLKLCARSLKGPSGSLRNSLNQTNAVMSLNEREVMDGNAVRAASRELLQ